MSSISKRVTKNTRLLVFFLGLISCILILTIPMLQEFLESRECLIIHNMNINGKELRGFSSQKELNNWLTSYNPIPYTPQTDCDDIAFDMCKKAFADGYWMWLQVESGDVEINGRMIVSGNVTHAMCSTIIGNDWYLISPTTKEHQIKWKVD